MKKAIECLNYGLDEDPSRKSAKPKLIKVELYRKQQKNRKEKEK
jgi:hypothetical protein